MGGIAGIFERAGAPVSHKLLSRQSELIIHRGAVREERWSGVSSGVVRRVSRSNAKNTERTKIFYDKESGWMSVCCGSLFNSREVRAQLEERGAQFRTLSDAETLLQAYRTWNIEGLAKCNGAFSCAFYHEAKHILVLAHDPLGLQPLVYWLHADRVVFASEAKAVIAHPSYTKQPDEVAIADYLSGHHLLLQNGRTFYRNVHKLLPGEALIIHGRKSKVHRYWQLDPDHCTTFSSDDECIEAVREIMLDAVRIRIPDDSHCGAALSGGFDSSSIVCMMDHVLRHEKGQNEGIDTFSFNFNSEDADESHLIELVSRKIGSRHHDVQVLTPNYFEDMKEMQRIHDGPILEESALLLWQKKKAAAQMNVDVLLSGLGGDELFMGRVQFLADVLRQGKFPSFYKEFRGLYPYDQSTGKKVSLKTLMLAYIAAPLEPYWLKNMRHIHLQKKYPPAWISSSLLKRVGIESRLPKPASPHFNTHFYQDCFEVFYYELLGCSTLFHDVSSAAFGMDSRFPLMDIRLVELLFSLPREWKISMGKVRHLQKEAMRPFLPGEILEDHLKKNFHPTMKMYLKDQYYSIFSSLMQKRDRASEAYMDWDVLSNDFREFTMVGNGRPDSLWFAFSLENWLRENF